MTAYGGRIMNELDLNPSLPHHQLTSTILESCFEVMKELGAGFLEAVYKNAISIALREKGLHVEIEKSYAVYYRDKKVGVYRADIVVENLILLELKCCKRLLGEHQAQVINYLVASNLPVGLLVNFNSKQLDWKRLHHPSHYPAAAGGHAYLANFF